MTQIGQDACNLRTASMCPFPFATFPVHPFPVINHNREYKYVLITVNSSSKPWKLVIFLETSNALGQYKNVKKMLKCTLGQRESISERKIWKGPIVLQARFPTSLEKM